ncbi:hypothetical protein Q5P01_000197, partial [Channa striata]
CCIPGCISFSGSGAAIVLQWLAWTHVARPSTFTAVLESLAQCPFSPHRWHLSASRPYPLLCVLPLLEKLVCSPVPYFGSLLPTCWHFVLGDSGVTKKRCQRAMVAAILRMICELWHNQQITQQLSNKSRLTRSVTEPAGLLDPYSATQSPLWMMDNLWMQYVQSSRGVPTLCWWCTTNKNVDWINQQRFINDTHDAIGSIVEQLAATSQMTWENRLATDVLLADKGGVCTMFGDSCCTLNNTAPDGSVTKALEGLRSLRASLKDVLVMMTQHLGLV